MKLIKPSFEIWEQPSGLEGVYKQIERAGRICYKSEDKITEDSAKSFVDRMIKSGHGAMLEHGTVYLYNPGDKQMLDMIKRYSENPYSRLKVVKADSTDAIIGPIWITTNYRVIVENNWEKDLIYYSPNPVLLHPKRITVHFVCDRGVSHEFVRHRVMSFAQESTRYCNYSKDKFGNECTFIYPNWFNKYFEDNYSNLNIRDWQTGLDIACAETNWIYAMLYAEKAYFSSISNGMKPQQARTVLPNSLKTELVMTGFVSDWKHFFKLRVERLAKGKPHPQASELATPLYEEFVARGYINN